MARLTLDRLPPYGYMFDDFERVAKECEQPPDWRGTKAQWNAWFRKTIVLLRDNVWPTYDRGKGWVGKARGHAIELTEVELGLMQDFRKALKEKAAWSTELTGLTHDQLFHQEDMDPFDRTLVRYCPGLGAISKDLADLVSISMDRKSWYVMWQMKSRFQRPRAYQASLLMRLPSPSGFSYGLARTSLSPSMISGHGLQGVMAGCTVYSMLERHDAELASANRKAIQQWSMDIGDRRVVAGVHYPSDNIASWIVGLTLVDHLFTGRGVRAFLSQAIRERSLVYSFLQKRIRSDPRVARAFRKPWQCLHDNL